MTGEAEALAAELCPRAGQPDHLSCRTCARVASWLERHDAALREEIDRLTDAWMVDEGIQADGSMRPSVSATVKRALDAEHESERLRQAGEQLAEALERYLSKHPCPCWKCSEHEALRSALSSWRAARGEKKP